MPLLNVDEAASELKCKPVSLYSKPFRARLGLIATKIGRNLRFDSRDVARVLAANREKLLLMPADEKEGADAAD